MAETGHEERFPPTMLSAGCGSTVGGQPAPSLEEPPAARRAVQVVIYGCGLSQLADRGTCHDRNMWLALGPRQARLLPHARVSAARWAADMLDHQLQLLELGIGRVALGFERVAFLPQALQRGIPRLEQRDDNLQLRRKLEWVLRRCGTVGKQDQFY
jgi:hypothetical protein